MGKQPPGFRKQKGLMLHGKEHAAWSKNKWRLKIQQKEQRKFVPRKSSFATADIQSELEQEFH